MRILKHQRATAGFAMAVVAVALAMAACGRGGPILGGPPGASTQAATDVEVFLELAKAPALYEPVEVTVTVTAKKPDRSPVEVWLELPTTAAFINGQMSWRGELPEGKTHQFSATIAFVAEGVSHLSAHARFNHPQSIYGIDEVGYGEWLRVTEGGGELRPTKGADEPGYMPPRQPLDGSTLVNLADKPRLLVIQRDSGLDELKGEGLVPADPWGQWHGNIYYPTGILDRDFEDNGVMVALFDRRRPTTGYHFAVLRVRMGADPKEPSGQPLVAVRIGEEPPPGITPVILDIIATAPRADWPVENRPVSPYEVFYLSFPLTAESTRADVMELFVRVNGEIIGSETVTRDGNSQSLTELELSAFNEAQIP